MLTIASLLHRKPLGLLRGSATEYTPGLYAAFEGSEFIANFPDETPFDLACASIARENARGLPDEFEKLKVLMELEAREGNKDATSWLQRYYPDESSVPSCAPSESSDAPAP